jgi:CheY-like chemotaxis protein
MFAAFIFLCGTTHLIEIWTVWNPDYRMQGAVKYWRPKPRVRSNGVSAGRQIAGHAVLVANSGRQALELCEQHQPDIAIIDIGMPDLSGHEVAARIRSSPWGREMILLAVTGWGQASDVQRALGAGFDRHLTKPVDPDTIETLIRQLVELKPIANSRRGYTST